MQISVERCWERSLGSLVRVLVVALAPKSDPIFEADAQVAMKGVLNGTA